MLLENISYQIDIIRQYADDILLIFLYCYFLNFINWIFLGSILNIFGIIPRNLFGLIGVVFYPILHGDSKHFFSNAFPLYVLIMFCLTLESMENFITIVFICHILTAAGLWFFARTGSHIGASALVSALFGWLLTVNMMEPTLPGFLILFVLLVYFGGIIIGLMPQQNNVSWEGHLIGFTSGVAVYVIQQHNQFFIIQTRLFSLFEPIA